MILPMMSQFGTETILHFARQAHPSQKKMVLADDMTIYQDVYCGGPLSTDHSKTYRNSLAMSPLKSFLKVKRTVQLIGNSKLSLAYKQIDNMERYAMTEYQLYEKKQERTLDRISRTSNNKRLKRLEKMISKNPLEEEDEEDSSSSQRLVRKRRRRVVAKKRASAGGSYMKRLKLASDNLKNTDPESSYGTVLNMDSYLAFKDFSNSKAGKSRRKSRRRGMSQTEQNAIELKAKQTLDKLVPKWRGEKPPKPLTDAEIERKKEELFENIGDLHTTLSISELLAQPRGRKGFRPSRVLDTEKKAGKKTRKVSKGFEAIFTTSNAIPLPTSKRDLPEFISRRSLAENNEVFKLTRANKNRQLRIDEEIALIGSYAGLTRSTYLRDDDGKLKEKRIEYNKQLDKLHRRKLGLKRSWINVVSLQKRRTSLDSSKRGLPKNTPMMPLIPNLKKRINKLNEPIQKPPSRANTLFLDILRRIEENEESEDHKDQTDKGSTSSSEKLILPAITKTPGRKLESQTSIVDFQKAFNLPTKTPTERRMEEEARKEQKQREGLKKKGGKLTLPSILNAMRPAIRMMRGRNGAVTSQLSTKELPLPVTSLNSLSTPNLPEKGSSPENRTKRRSSISDLNSSLSSEDLGFKMNIFLSGLSSSSKPDMPPVVG